MSAGAGDVSGVVTEGPKDPGTCILCQVFWGVGRQDLHPVSGVLGGGASARRLERSYGTPRPQG